MDTPESDEDSYSRSEFSGSGRSLSALWKNLVENFRRIGSIASARQGAPHERFTHAAIMRSTQSSALKDSVADFKYTQASRQRQGNGAPEFAASDQ